MENMELKPVSVFKYFAEVCNVPRPSKKEEKIIATSFSSLTFKVCSKAMIPGTLCAPSMSIFAMFCGLSTPISMQVICSMR